MLCIAWYAVEKYCLSVCLSFRQSVTLQYRVKTARYVVEFLHLPRQLH